MENTKKIIEINGVKLEVDMREAREISSYKVGDKVKLLVKEYSSYQPYFGTIVGFDNFQNLPTITVAYLKTDYNGADIKFAYINAKSSDKDSNFVAEICPARDVDAVLEKGTIVEQFDKQILKAREQVNELERKKKFFLDNFGKYFE